MCVKNSNLQDNKKPKILAESAPRAAILGFGNWTKRRFLQWFLPTWALHFVKTLHLRSGPRHKLGLFWLKGVSCNQKGPGSCYRALGSPSGAIGSPPLLALRFPYGALSIADWVPLRIQVLAGPQFLNLQSVTWSEFGAPTPVLLLAKYSAEKTKYVDASQPPHQGDELKRR